MKKRTITLTEAARRLSELTGGSIGKRRTQILVKTGKLGARWDKIARRFLCSELDIEKCAADLDTNRRRKPEGASVSRTTLIRRARRASAS